MKSSRLVTRYGPLCLVSCTGHRGYSLGAELWRSSVCKGMVGEVNLGSVTVTLRHCRHPRGNVKQATDVQMGPNVQQILVLEIKIKVSP